MEEKTNWWKFNSIFCLLPLTTEHSEPDPHQFFKVGTGSASNRAESATLLICWLFYSRWKCDNCCWDKKYHSCLYLHDSSVPAAGDVKQLQNTKKIYQCSCWKSFNIDISYKARLVIGLFVSIDPAADVHGEWEAALFLTMFRSLLCSVFPIQGKEGKSKFFGSVFIEPGSGSGSELFLETTGYLELL